MTEPTWADFRSLQFSARGYPLTRGFSQRLGALIAYAAFRIGLSPSAVTAGGLALNVAGSVVYVVTPPGAGGALLALLLYQLAYGFDCADGQLARASGRVSAFGAWLDLSLDYLRCVLISGSALLMLVRHGYAADVAAWPAGLLLAGLVLSAHTGIAMRHASHVANSEHGLKSVIRTLIDTPTVLLLFCALRDQAVLLAAYCSAAGIADLAVAFFVAHRRLARPD